MRDKRVILVGVSGMGANWARILHESKDWNVVAYVDINRDALSVAAERYGMAGERCHSTLSAANTAHDAEAVVIATPPNTHARLIREALDAGLHILCEKPATDDWVQLVAVLHRAREFGLTVMINQNYRYWPASMEVIRHLRSSSMGTVNYITSRCRMPANHAGSYRANMQHPVLLERCIHMFDQIRYYLASDAAWCFTTSWNPSWSWTKGDACVAATFQMKNGAFAHCFVDWASHAHETSYFGRWDIEAEEAALSTDGSTLKSYVRGIESESITLPHVDPVGPPLAESLTQLARAVEFEETPATSLADHAHSLAMSFAAMESVETGRRVSLDSYYRDLSSM